MASSIQLDYGLVRLWQLVYKREDYKLCKFMDWLEELTRLKQLYYFTDIDEDIILGSVLRSKEDEVFAVAGSALVCKY